MRQLHPNPTPGAYSTEWSSICLGLSQDTDRSTTAQALFFCQDSEQTLHTLGDIHASLHRPSASPHVPPSNGMQCAISPPHREGFMSSPDSGFCYHDWIKVTRTDTTAFFTRQANPACLPRRCYACGDPQSRKSAFRVQTHTVNKSERANIYNRRSSGHPRSRQSVQSLVRSTDAKTEGITTLVTQRLLLRGYPVDKYANERSWLGGLLRKPVLSQGDSECVATVLGDIAIQDPFTPAKSSQL